MLKIAILSDRFPPFSGGGIASANYNLYHFLRSFGYDVRIFTYLEDVEFLPVPLEEENIFRFGITQIENKRNHIKSILINKCNKWIFRKRKEGYAYQIHIIKVARHGVKKINQLLKTFKPDVVFLPDFGVPGLSLNKLEKSFYIHISHNIPTRYLNNPLIGMHSPEDALEAVRLEQESLKKIDLVICPSQYMKDIFIKTFEFDKPIKVIPNLLNFEFIKNIKKKDVHSILHLKPNIPIVYVPSAGNSIKGSRFVVEIIRRLSRMLNYNVGFYLSGRITEEQLYEIDNLPVKNKIFKPGNISYEENISYLKSCKLCISPTLMESFGMALMEALICGLPCVTFNIEATGEIVKNEKLGYTVPYLDIEQLIEKSHAILTDQNLHSNLKENIKFSLDGEKSNSTALDHYLSILKSNM